MRVPDSPMLQLQAYRRRALVNIFDIHPRAVIAGDRVFVALRKAGRTAPGRGRVYHAVTPYCRIALCSNEPGAGSGWAEPPAKEVTCRECLRRIRALAPWLPMVASGNNQSRSRSPARAVQLGLNPRPTRRLNEPPGRFLDHGSPPTKLPTSEAASTPDRRPTRAPKL